MITKWKVFNFKSIQKETELELAPLTVFTGANSSGKSTFLQTILLVAQTLAHKVSSRSVVLNGAFTRLGQFDDLRSVDSTADQIVIGWTCQPLHDAQSRRVLGLRSSPFYYGRSRHALSSVSCEIAFDTDDSGAQKEITQIQPRLFSSQLSALTRDPEGGDRRSFMTIRRTSISNDTSKQKWMDACDSDEPRARASLQYDVECDEGSLADIREDFVSAVPMGISNRPLAVSCSSNGCGTSGAQAVTSTASNGARLSQPKLPSPARNATLEMPSSSILIRAAAASSG